MNFENLYGTIRFGSFENVVSWLCSLVPYYYVDVFVLGCLFAILKIIMHFGSSKIDCL